MNTSFILPLMDSGSKFETTLLKHLERVPLSERYQGILIHFFRGYQKAVLEAGYSNQWGLETVLQFLKQVEIQLQTPYLFSPYHQKIRAPFDFYQFSLDFIRPLIRFQESTLQEKELFQRVCHQISQGENVIFLANHQTEPDPQILSLLLNDRFPSLAEQIIYVAGERVLTDPLAVPLSLGCDLLCIYSKRYIDSPQEKKAEKQLHNQNTMHQMRRLLSEGGKCIYVAPSGGRDRKNASGQIEIAPFDPQSIEMFYLMARRANTSTHFYPLTLNTYALMPPPEKVQSELGERREVQRSAVDIYLAPEFDMENFPGSEENDKMKRRQQRAQALWNIVHQNYQTLRRS